VFRYYNQQILICTASISTKRPLKRNLVYTFSILNGNEIKSNRHTEYFRFSLIEQPKSYFTGEHECLAKKRHLEALPQISADDHISAYTSQRANRTELFRFEFGSVRLNF
jgi:hypothetical protein